MPRAATKIELISAANDGWDKLWKMIDAQPEAGTVAFDFGDDPKLKETHWKRYNNLRDVFCSFIRVASAVDCMGRE